MSNELWIKITIGSLLIGGFLGFCFGSGILTFNLPSVSAIAPAASKANAANTANTVSAASKSSTVPSPLSFSLPSENTTSTEATPSQNLPTKFTYQNPTIQLPCQTLALSIRINWGKIQKILLLNCQAGTKLTVYSEGTGVAIIEKSKILAQSNSKSQGLAVFTLPHRIPSQPPLGVSKGTTRTPKTRPTGIQPANPAELPRTQINLSTEIVVKKTDYYTIKIDVVQVP